jgi:hypothetical protein
MLLGALIGALDGSWNRRHSPDKIERPLTAYLVAPGRYLIAIRQFCPSFPLRQILRVHLARE